MKLSLKEYMSPATELAPYLIGKILCRKLSNGTVIKKRITETECYFGEEDTACHAHKGKTDRTKILYEQGGIAYVYLCYGIHSLLNVVSGEENHPECVLIRGIDNYSGPGKLTKSMDIDRRINGVSLVNSDVIWIENDSKEFEYTMSKRIGIDYADKDDIDKLWRFTMKNGTVLK